MPVDSTSHLLAAMLQSDDNIAVYLSGFRYGG